MSMTNEQALDYLRGVHTALYGAIPALKQIEYNHISPTICSAARGIRDEVNAGIDLLDDVILLLEQLESEFRVEITEPTPADEEVPTNPRKLKWTCQHCGDTNNTSQMVAGNPFVVCSECGRATTWREVEITGYE